MNDVVQIGTATATVFGDGCRHRLPDLITEQVAHVLVVASASSLRRPAVATLRETLAKVARVSVWDQVQPNPRTGDIDECVARYSAANVTHIIGIGGGSAMDQAKATAMALHCGLDMSSLLARKGPLPQRDNRLILVPTTSGTGAELSYGAILTNTETSEKLGLRGVTMAADHALVDPELTWTVPVAESMVTGFDVLTHALETWLSRAASPYTRDLSRGAIERVFRWLPVIHDKPNDVVARRELSYASMIMGINLALSTTCLPHRLQYPVGAATDTAHAAGLAALYPAWLDHVRPHAQDRLADCADWIGLLSGEDTAKRADAFVAAVKGLLKRIGLTTTLQDLGVTTEMVAGFPDEVSGKLDTDPCYFGARDVAEIYTWAFAMGER